MLHHTGPMTSDVLGVTTDDAPPRPRRAAWAFLKNIWDTAKVFLVSLAIIIPFRAYVAQPFFVRGASMTPNFHDGEYLIVDELSYRLHVRPPQRGDVVVFQYPLDPSQYFIKRIIGLPGETVRIRGGVVTVVSQAFPQGVVLDESPYLEADEQTDGDLEVTVRSGEWFLLGDNRNHSSDSRAWGPLPERLIVGRAWVRAFPLSRVGVIATPWYGSLTTAAADATRGNQELPLRLQRVPAVP